MTAAEFDALTDPEEVWKVFARFTPHRGRKWVLAAHALAGLLTKLLNNPQTILALEMLDRFADTPSTHEERAEAVWNAQEAAEFNSFRRNATDAQGTAAIAVQGFVGLDVLWGTQNARNALARVSDKKFGKKYTATQKKAGSAQSRILREVLGNPFRPVPFKPEWRTSTAVAIAKGMYESRDFSAMPILADSLQDAGCENDDVLKHCRNEKGTHVRGCWVVDLVLGKS